MWSMIFHCCSLSWLSVILGPQLMLTEVAMLCPRCPTTNFWDRFLLAQAFHATFCWGSLLSHILYHHTLRWNCIIPPVSLLLTEVDLRYLRCPTATHSGDWVSSQIFHICSLELSMSSFLFHCCTSDSFASNKCFTAVHIVALGFLRFPLPPT